MIEMKTVLMILSRKTLRNIILYVNADSDRHLLFQLPFLTACIMISFPHINTYVVELLFCLILLTNDMIHAVRKKWIVEQRGKQICHKAHQLTLYIFHCAMCAHPAATTLNSIRKIKHWCKRSKKYIQIKQYLGGKIINMKAFSY